MRLTRRKPEFDFNLKIVKDRGGGLTLIKTEKTRNSRRGPRIDTMEHTSSGGE